MSNHTLTQEKLIINRPPVIGDIAAMSLDWINAIGVFLTKIEIKIFD